MSQRARIQRQVGTLKGETPVEVLAQLLALVSSQRPPNHPRRESAPTPPLLGMRGGEEEENEEQSGWDSEEEENGVQTVIPPAGARGKAVLGSKVNYKAIDREDLEATLSKKIR